MHHPQCKAQSAYRTLKVVFNDFLCAFSRTFSGPFMSIFHHHRVFNTKSSCSVPETCVYNLSPKIVTRNRVPFHFAEFQLTKFNSPNFNPNPIPSLSIALSLILTVTTLVVNLTHSQLVTGIRQIEIQWVEIRQNERIPVTWYWNAINPTETMYLTPDLQRCNQLFRVQRPRKFSCNFCKILLTDKPKNTAKMCQMRQNTYGVKIVKPVLKHVISVCN